MDAAIEINQLDLNTMKVSVDSLNIISAEDMRKRMPFMVPINLFSAIMGTCVIAAERNKYSATVVLTEPALKYKEIIVEVLSKKGYAVSTYKDPTKDAVTMTISWGENSNDAVRHQADLI